MLVYVRTVVLGDLIKELMRLGLLRPGLLQQQGQLRLYSQLVVYVRPADVGRLLSDCHSGVFDDLGDLIF